MALAIRGLSKLPRRLLNWVEDHSSGRQYLVYSDQELCRILQDIGLERDNLGAPTDFWPPEPSKLLLQRLNQLGLDPTYIQLSYAGIYQDLRWVCASCKARRLCRRDLALGNVQVGMESYCLNAPTIDALLVEPSRSPEA